MLSEDEREAIERLKAQLNFWKKQNIKNSDCEIILNLITKLQKENEELQKQCISKDKIRELINERQFELQQEYKDFKDDIRLNTLQEIYYLGDGINDRK